MIIDNNVDYNNYSKEILEFYGFWRYTCPCCGAKSHFIRHGYYERHIIVLEDSILEEHQIEIVRLFCKSCESTHAVLPAGTIPYSLYSIDCIFLILTMFFLNNDSATEISNKTSAPNHMIYLFVSKFLKELVSCIHFLNTYIQAGILEFANTATRIIDSIQGNLTPLGFFQTYFFYTQKIFMMTRRRFILSHPLYIGM